MFLRFCQILGISSEYVQSVFRVCSECVQSVFRVCSILKSFHHLAHLVCQFLAFFNMRHLERFNDLLTLLTITDQLRQIEAFYLAFFWSLHIFCLTFFLF